MGVHALWDIVGPTAKPVRLESLSNKRLAVDASIWIYQFLKAVRDKEGNAMRYSHIVGFFRRICKLLYFGIKPVFVFDGGAPALKRRTIQQRKERRQGRRDNAAITARKLLARQMQSDGHKASTAGTPQPHVHKLNDEYELPKIPGFKYDSNDARINADDFKTIMENIDELDGVDLDSINPASKEFDELPKSTQYMILSALRLKSRLRLGYSKEQLENLFPDSMEFSRFQINMVKRRNFFTQKLMSATNTHDGGASKADSGPSKRVAGQQGREYQLIRTENGWALSLTGDDGSEISKAIVLDERPQSKTSEGHDNDGDDEDADVDWEDVDVEDKGKKEEVDYSVKASLLPAMGTTAQSGGGQSFLDKRHADSRSDKTSGVVHVSDEIVWNDAEKRSSYAVPASVRDDDNDDGDDGNEYADFEKDLELMNELKNKNSGRETKHELVDLRSSDREVEENEHSHSINVKESTTPTKLSEIDNQPALKVMAKPQDSVESVVYKPAELPTNSEQNLQHVLDKISEANSDSPVESKEVAARESDQPPEKPKLPTPEWFKSSNPSDFNPHLGTSFLTSDRTADPKQNGEEAYGLYTGSRAADLISAASGRNEKLSDSDDLKEIHPTEKVVVESPSPSSPQEEAEKTSECIPVVDYDFSEEEEDALVSQLREEEQDYEMFKTALNPSSISATFIDDELRGQEKRDKRDSDEVTAAMVAEVQDLLTRFGIPYLTAPMEAEAQCAELLILNLVDGIITDDSDIFLFGGDKVYKNMFQEKNYVEHYYGDMILKELGLDREKFIDLAQLLGSDYTAGVKSIGPVSAMEVLAEFESLTRFRDWYNEGQFDKKLQEKESSYEKKLRKKLATNEVTLGAEFPSDLVKEAYLRPEVDHDATKFTWGVPDLDRLREFFKMTIGWPQEKTDEVMIPLIREVNNRKKTGIQNTLTSFFPTEYIKAGKDLKLGKRIKDASGKMKMKKQRTK
ncbi:LAME_0G06744g1_1 [Lachancea meyersii CBS 8951]|uniref:LAME_0G06744g1_1 n=1 Tax=Lachancea meyersii CBS 8951 TaxID=1266667 RepID=A0A1G4K7Q0_9SACH|nr:LAME_0G06744g1_1 [Lachancea meyersii CBS 8951]